MNGSNSSTKKNQPVKRVDACEPVYGFCPSDLSPSTYLLVYRTPNQVYDSTIDIATNGFHFRDNIFTTINELIYSFQYEEVQGQLEKTRAELDRAQTEVDYYRREVDWLEMMGVLEAVKPKETTVSFPTDSTTDVRYFYKELSPETVSLDFPPVIDPSSITDPNTTSAESLDKPLHEASVFGAEAPMVTVSDPSRDTAKYTSGKYTSDMFLIESKI